MKDIDFTGVRGMFCPIVVRFEKIVHFSRFGSHVNHVQDQCKYIEIKQ